MKKIILTLSYILLAFNLSASDFTIVIDAGHGGRDSGAKRGTIYEKNISLSTAVMLGKLIEQNHKDVKVVYTRKTDVFVDLFKRADIANKAKANLFISLHVNATRARNTSARGTETFILGLHKSQENLEVAQRENSVILLEEDYNTKYEGFDPKSAESYIIFEFMTNKYMDQSLQLASYIQSSFKTRAKRFDRGVKQAGLVVLRQSAMPSVLVELGFINNSAEVKYLNSKQGQEILAKSVYEGFKKYKSNFDQMQGKHETMANSDNSKTTNTAVVQTSLKQEKEYKVQFLISKKKLPNNSSQFKGLKSVDYYVEDGIYKYTYGSEKELKDIIRLRNEIKTKFKDCFIITYKNGKRIK